MSFWNSLGGYVTFSLVWDKLSGRGKHRPDTITSLAQAVADEETYELESEMEELRSRLDDLQDRLDSCDESDFDELQDAIEDLQERLDSSDVLWDDCGDLQDMIDGLQDRLDTMSDEWDDDEYDADDECGQYYPQDEDWDNGYVDPESDNIDDEW